LLSYSRYGPAIRAVKKFNLPPGVFSVSKKVKLLKSLERPTERRAFDCAIARKLLECPALR